MRIPRSIESLTAWHAAAIFTLLAVAWSWPLARVMSTSVAWDLGDPMLVAWVMGWVNDSVLALARGDAARFLTMWDAPIFYPEALTLAYSEHFIPQALMVLPLHAVTGNIVLAYNVAVLATFVLSGVGMFLLVRELTGSTLAGLVAGVIFAFTPYRVDRLSHLQVLSSQWMPFALYGLRRYFVTGRIRPLVWGTLALVALNLSSGYYLFFFLPFVVAYVLGEMWGRGLLRQARAWRDVAIAGAASAALTIPFLIPYLAVRRGRVGHRSYDEIVALSADVYAYATGSVYIPWMRDVLDAVRTPENSAFPGVVAIAFFLGALALVAMRVTRRWTDAPRGDSRRDRIVAGLLVGAAVFAVFAVWTALTGGTIVHLLGVEIRLRNFLRFLVYAAVLFSAALALSARLREALRGPAGSLAGPALVAVIAAFLLSLGPRMESLERFIGHGPYALLLKTVPGYDGLRVPARFAMIVVLWMAIAGGYAATALSRARWGGAALAAAALLAVIESRPSPFLINYAFNVPGHAPLTRAHMMAGATPLYRWLDRAPTGVLMELPFGTVGWDIQYMVAQRQHGWPLVNGYSGHIPESYLRNAVVTNAHNAPGPAWRALNASGATHVIVHEWAFSSPARGARISRWLLSRGATVVLRSGSDVLYALPAPRPLS